MPALSEIALWVGGRLIGDGAKIVVDVSGVRDAGPDDITYAVGEPFVSRLKSGTAGAAFLREPVEGLAVPQIIVDDPKAAAIATAARLRPVPTWAQGTAAEAYVDAAAEVDPTASVMPGAYVGPRARVGARTVLMPGVCVMNDARVGCDGRLYPGVYIGAHCIVGDRAILWPHACIGADGFGFVNAGGRQEKIPQMGVVVIGDDVEIGASSCVDRATVGATVVGEGTKIDNQVQVGHNDAVGRHCIIVAQAGMAGSVRLGDYSVLAAKAGVADNVDIGMATIVGAGSGVLSDVGDGARVAGIPAVHHIEWKRNIGYIRRIKDLIAEIKDLRRRLTDLERKVDRD